MPSFKHKPKCCKLDSFVKFSSFGNGILITRNNRGHKNQKHCKPNIIIPILGPITVTPQASAVGTSITIMGSGFVPGITVVSIGSVVLSSAFFTILNGNTIIAIVPLQPPNATTIVVTNGPGNSVLSVFVVLPFGGITTPCVQACQQSLFACTANPECQQLTPQGQQCREACIATFTICRNACPVN